MVGPRVPHQTSRPAGTNRRWRDDDAGSGAKIANSGTATAPVLDFCISTGMGFYFRGAYAGGTAYLKDDVVTYNGSSYIAKQATTGNLPTNTTYWAMLAQQGDGGDMYKATYDPQNFKADVFNSANNAYDNTATGATATNVKAAIDEAMARQLIGPNVWINGNCDIWQKGPAMPAPAAVGGYQCDFIGHRGTNSTVFVERKNFALGPSDVPGHPKYFFRITVDSVPDADSVAVVAVDIDDVRTFAGSKATLTFYAKADAAKDITIAHEQYFGEGGSPSPSWGGTPYKVSLATGWKRFDIVLDDWPSVVGKTIGTSDTVTDRIGIIIYLDAGSNFDGVSDNLGQQSGVFDFARFSLREDVHGVIPATDDPFPVEYTVEAELLRCQTLLQVFTDTELVWSGYVESGGTRWLGVPARVPMRRTPEHTVTKVAQSGFAGTPLVSANKYGAQIALVGTSTVNSGFFTATLILDANHPYTP